MESSNSDGLRILHINNVTLALSGEVQLVVTHPGKSNSSLKSYTSLAVIPRSTTSDNLIESTDIPTDFKIPLSNNRKRTERSQQPAFILEGPRDCTALIGGCVRLSIIFEGLPKPQVRWFKAVSFFLFFSIKFSFKNRINKKVPHTSILSVDFDVNDKCVYLIKIYLLGITFYGRRYRNDNSISIFYCCSYLSSCRCMYVCLCLVIVHGDIFPYGILWIKRAYIYVQVQLVYKYVELFNIGGNCNFNSL